MIVCALLGQLVPPHVALKQSGDVDMDPFAPHQEAAKQQAPQQEVPQQGAPLPPLPRTQQEKHSQQAAQEQARHEQHEQQARQQQAAQQQARQQQAANPPDCPTAAEVQATAEGERWAVWDVPADDDPESSACRLDQLAGECGDEIAPCKVRPKDSVAQRAEAALRAKQLALYQEFRGRQYPAEFGNASAEQCAPNVVSFDGDGEGVWKHPQLWGKGSGWGSHHTNLLGNAGRLALMRKAVLVQKVDPVWLWSPDGKGVETYLEPVSSCDRRAANATLRADQILHCRGCDDDALAPVLAALLRPNAKVRAAETALRDRIGWSNETTPIIGLHVREGDKGIESPLHPLVEHIDALRKYMKAGDLPSDARVYVATDSSEVIKELKNKKIVGDFHGRFLYNPDALRAPGGLTQPYTPENGYKDIKAAGFDAFLDVLTLAGCDHYSEQLTTSNFDIGVVALFQGRHGFLATARASSWMKHDAEVTGRRATRLWSARRGGPLLF